MTHYPKSFYLAQQSDSLRSARAVLPLLFSHYRPASVIDAGCGMGTWLKACQELGIADIQGIDGDHVDRQSLVIPQQHFLSANLAEPISVPRRFDLALSLEVAEHLPPHRAKSFVEDLTRLSDVILFSAAIPYQGGTAHINENWMEYWAILFRSHGYEPLDFLRPRLWNNRDVCFWYRQNLIIFARKSCIDGTGLESACRNLAWPLSVVHPEMFLRAVARGRGIAGSREPHDIEISRALGSAWTDGKVDVPDQPYSYRDEFHDDFRGFAPMRILKRWLGRLLR